jgi:hypothetical protein
VSRLGDGDRSIRSGHALTVTCGHPHPHYGRITSHDPGFALTTGRCPIGKIVAVHARHDRTRCLFYGSAADLRTVIDYYERRYNIGYTEQEKQDLVNLMGAL